MKLLWTGEAPLRMWTSGEAHEVIHCTLAPESREVSFDSAIYSGDDVVCLVEFEHSGRFEAALDYLGRRHPLLPVGLVARRAQRPEAFALLQKRRIDRVVAFEDVDSDLDAHLLALQAHGKRLAELSKQLRVPGESTLFVTGATGFLGGHFLRYLMRCSNARVIALTRSTPHLSHHVRLDHLAQLYPGRIRCIAGDICQPGLGLDAQARAMLTGVDAVWHFAADTRFEPLLRETVFRVNLEGTRNLLQLARELPGLKRCYHVSTAYIAGEQRPGTVVNETRLAPPVAFKNPYEESKYLAECAATDSGLPVTIFRPSIILGERISGLCDGQTVYKVAQLIRLARLSGRRSLQSACDSFRVVVDPDTTKNFITADDVVVQMLQIAASGGAPGGFHHLTHPEPTRMADLIAVIAELLDIPEYEAVLSLEGESLSPSEALLQRISGVFKPYMLSSDPVFARTQSVAGITSPVDRACLNYLMQSFLEQHYGWEAQPDAVLV